RPGRRTSAHLIPGAPACFATPRRREHVRTVEGEHLTTVEIESILATEELNTLLETAESSGQLGQSELAEIIEPPERGPLESEAIHQELDRRGIELLVEPVAEVEPEPEKTPPPVQAAAESTTDALQLFLREAGRHQLLTAAQEVELAKRIERGDMAAKTHMIQ